MPIKTKSSAVERSTIQTYFTKKAGQMPTKSEWFNFINSALNIKDDLNIEQSDVEGLADALAKKLEKEDLPKTPTAEEQFTNLKSLIESLIVDKTKDIAAAAAKSYVPALTDMLTDTEPVGRIAQFIGEEDDYNRLYPGYFYKKIREHNPDGDNNGSAATQDGTTLNITKKGLYTVNGETYVGNWQIDDKTTGDENFYPLSVNNRYIIFVVKESAVFNPDNANHARICAKVKDMLPIAYDTQEDILVTTSWGKYPGTTSGDTLAAYVNGELVDKISTLIYYAQMVLRESDQKPFRVCAGKIFVNDQTQNAQFTVLIPAYADGLYDITADEEFYEHRLYQANETPAPNPAAVTNPQTGDFETLTITPRLPIRGTSDYNTDPDWKMIQVSPFILED